MKCEMDMYPDKENLDGGNQSKQFLSSNFFKQDNFLTSRYLSPELKANTLKLNIHSIKPRKSPVKKRVELLVNYANSMN